MDDPLCPCLLHSIGQAGNEEQQKQRVAIQSEAFLVPACICVHQIATFHLACKIMIETEALNEVGLFVSNKLSMEERHEKRRLKEHLCVFFPLLNMLHYKNE